MMMMTYDVFPTVAAESGIPVWFEPVSVAKSRRVASVVKYVSASCLLIITCIYVLQPSLFLFLLTII